MTDLARALSLLACEGSNGKLSPHVWVHKAGGDDADLKCEACDAEEEFIYLETKDFLRDLARQGIHA